MRRSAALAIVVAALAACGGGTHAPRAATTTTIATSSTATTRPTTASTTVSPPTTTTLPPAQPRVSSDPSTLAKTLVADERAIRDPATPAAAFTAASRRAQLAYRMLGHHPEWNDRVMAGVPTDLAPTVSRNIDARRHFAQMVADQPVRDTLPAWRIAAPATTAELLAAYHEGDARFGVGWSYLAAINLVETGLGRIVGLSTAGAQGPMQFLPSTWAAYGDGGDIDSPHDSIVGAARYLAANGFADGNIDGALYRYNNSADYVAAVKDYAEALAAEPATFAAYHEWDVYYFTVAGDVLLPVGYEQHDPIPVADYLATHPQ